MSIRHVAAFALVGWYLIMPNFDEFQWASGPVLAEQLPLSEWKVLRGFDRLEDCENVRADAIKAGDEITKTSWAYDIRCIAMDDPRLKSN